MSKAVLNIPKPAYRKLCKKKLLSQQTETNNTKIKTKEFWNASPFPLVFRLVPRNCWPCRKKFYVAPWAAEPPRYKSTKWKNQPIHHLYICNF